MSTAIVNLQTPERPWAPQSAPLTVGKDVLELLSTSMYVDAMTLYREYIQNAADSIDEARTTGVLKHDTPGHVEVSIDAGKRVIRIRDNGTGIPGGDFERRLCAFGASSKRGTRARGFRGVGRLAAIGYCQELIFRSRYPGESNAYEMKWDCRKVKTSLRANNELTLQEVINNCLQVRVIDGKQLPEHFFEVEILGVIRHRNDSLLNAAVVYDYLSQVAPVPFSPDFSHREHIGELLAGAAVGGDLDVRISEISEPVFRPHRDRLLTRTGGEEIRFTEVEVVHVPATDTGDAALGWVLHHEYKGAIPFPQLRGLRLRSGNIQVGGNDLMQEVFQETRFNWWAVGELHTIDQRIIPNGRRDHFEQNIHFDNLVNHISVVARNIGVRCRTSSSQRNWVKKFAQHCHRVQERLQVLEQGAVGRGGVNLLSAEIACDMAEMQKIAAKQTLPIDVAAELSRQVEKLSDAVARCVGTPRINRKLKKLSPVKRHIYEHAFALIYKHVEDRVRAHRLVEAMLCDLPTR